MLPVVVVAIFLLATTGVFLMLHRSLLRVALGLGCFAHAIHLLILSAGKWGSRAPLVREGVGPADVMDPLTQAFVLTAIVISMAFTLYLLAGMAVRTRRGGVPRVETPPASDDGRDPERVAAELRGEREP